LPPYALPNFLLWNILATPLVWGMVAVAYQCLDRGDLRSDGTNKQSTGCSDAGSVNSSVRTSDTSRQTAERARVADEYVGG